MKMPFFLLSTSLNPFITRLEFFYWLTSRCFISVWLIFSHLTLLTLQSSLFEGLIRDMSLLPPPEQYKKKENVTKTYKKSAKRLENSFKLEAKSIA